MSQNATLYRLNQDNFSTILADPEGTDIFSITKGYVTFQQTHEGLLFVLSKNQHETTTKLIRQIFYPESSNNESDDFSKINAGILPGNLDFDSFYKMVENLLLYNKPEVVREIAAFLNKFSENDFQSLFNYNELNKAGVYPYKFWSNESKRDTRFDVEHMTKDFIRLNAFYQAASAEGDYVLSFVG